MPSFVSVRPLPAWSYAAIAFAPVAAACVAVGRGAPAIAASAVAHLTTGALVLVLERVRPYAKAWNVPRGDLRVDVTHLVVDSAFGGASWRLLAAWFLAITTAHAGLRAWPSAWPLGAQVVLGVVVQELVGYALHFAMHRVRWLWPFHAVHHSVPRLHLPSAFRSHPVDVLLTVVLPLAPLVLLGASEDVIVLTTCAIGVHGMVQHANVDFAAGAVDWVIATARVHRRHHARDVVESEANYGGTVLVWDLVFGTRRDVAAPPSEDVGLRDPASVPVTYLGQLLAPFARRTRAQESWRTAR